MNSNPRAALTPFDALRPKISATVGRIATGTELVSFSESGALFSGAIPKLVKARPGHIYLIDKIKLSGSMENTANACVVQLSIANSADTIVGQIDLNMSTRGSTAYAGRVDQTYEIGGSIVVPENCYLQATWLTATTALTDRAACTVEVYGGYITEIDAIQSGISQTKSSGDWFCKSISPATQTSAELVAAKTGKSIEIHGYIASGRAAVAALAVAINHCVAGGTTQPRPVFKFRLDNADTARPLNVYAANIERNMPVGRNLIYTSTVNVTGASDASRASVCVWGRYVTNPDTYNPDGVPDISGDASATTAANPTAFSDTDKAWQTDVLTGMTIEFTSGECLGQTRTIQSNTATAITVTLAWVGTITAGDTYRLVVRTGRKWWVCRADAATAVNTEVCYRMLNDSLKSYGELREFQFNGLPTSDATRVQPSMLEYYVADNAVEGGSGGTDRDIPLEGVFSTYYLPGTSIGASAGTKVSLGCAVIAVDNGDNVNSAISRVLIPFPKASSGNLVALLSHGWTAANFSCGGTFVNDAAYSSSTAAVGSRFST